MTTPPEIAPRLSPAELDAIVARYTAASPGPWVVDGSYVRSDAHHIADLDWLAQDEDEVAAMRADAEFIARAREDLPRLVEEVRRVHGEACAQAMGHEAEVETLRAQLSAYHASTWAVAARAAWAEEHEAV